MPNFANTFSHIFQMVLNVTIKKRKKTCIQEKKK